MSRVVATVLLTAGVANAGLFENCESLFEDFKTKFAVKYGSTVEESKRQAIFCSNMKKADQYNVENGSPAFGVSKFADRTDDEFAVNLGRKNSGKAGKQGLGDFVVRNPSTGGAQYGMKSELDKPYSGTLPDTVDWTEAGYVTAVKNQGQCGACWAFSVAETVESQWALNGNAIWEFSPQQVTSCTPNTFGCGGGDTVYGYEYIMSLPANQGLGSAAFAPFVQSMYEGCSGPLCTEACSSINVTALDTYSSLTGPYAQVSGYQYATTPCVGACASQDLNLLAENIATYGPASVCVDASRWNLYTGGVVSVSGCGGYAYSDLDHCVQLTGYVNNVDTPYWTVRNSWATNWGENGYIYLQFDANTCGLADEATFVTISNSQP